jgi:hypothetical protein
MRTPRAAALALLLTSVAAALGACGERVAGPSSAGVAVLALQPRWPAAVMANAVFGAGIDTVEITVSRQNEQTAASRVVPFPSGQEGLRFSLSVPLTQRTETLYVSIDLRQAGTTMFYGNAQVVLSNGAIPQAPDLPLFYQGPGYDAVFVSLTPRTGFVQPGDTVQFSAVAQNGQQQIVAAPIAWSLSDSSLARIDATGRFISRGGLGTVRVRATTPTGVADSLSVTISPQVP